MNKWTGNVMSLEHFNDFYYLEALMAGISMAYSNHPEWAFKHSLNRLENDVKDAFNHLTHEMALRIYVYLWAAALGEARYAKGHGLKYWISDLNGDTRSDAYNKSLDYFPCQENVNIVKNTFNQQWGSAYGGKAWLNIVEAMEMYGKVSDATFIDHSVDLEHNGGCVFSKSARFGLDCGAYSLYSLKAFLDFKFRGDLLQSPVMLGDVPQVTRVSSKVYRLIERFMNVTTEMGTGKYVNMVVTMHFLKPTMSWLDGYTVEWDTKMLSAGGKMPETKKPTVKKTVSKSVTGAHIARIVVGHSYYVKYDNNDYGCGWDHSGMDRYDNTVITISEVGYHGFGKSGKWWYAKEWLYEVQDKPVAKVDASLYEERAVRRLEIGKTYLVIHNDIYARNCSWVAPMDKYDGQEITISEKGLKYGSARNGYGAGTGWWFSPKWLHAKKEAVVRKEERREDRHANEVWCYRCGGWYSRYDIYYSSISGENYCEDCYCETFSSCDHCGHEDYDEHMVQTSNHPSYFKVCDGCASELGKTCEHCEEWYPNSDVLTTRDGYLICTDCASDFQCDYCGEYHYAIASHVEEEREAAKNARRMDTLTKLEVQVKRLRRVAMAKGAVHVVQACDEMLEKIAIKKNGVK